MQQGFITDIGWKKLKTEDKKSLELIRLHFKSANYLSEGVNSQELVDKSFEAMGKRFRTRINREIASYGRYKNDKHDGVFLIIQGAIRDYDAANQFFPPKASDAKRMYQQFQNERGTFGRSTTKSIKNLSVAIEWLKERTPLKFEEEQLNEAEEALNKISEILELQLKSKGLVKCPNSSAENFVKDVCGFLMWYANIKPTKAITDTGDKTPLLRFLEVYYPFEAEVALSSLYEKEKRAAPHDKIGSSFMPVV
ncbi:hypothetical protein [Marinomonas sp. PE14-40]|uniref:hypothetical protein n=1 Tax=Marinomonas sp. PE14-40 TaxID=3060621 RepID=UPI003F680231